MVKVRAAMSVLVAAVLAVGIAGCSFTNGDQTLPRNYDPSDGVSATVGQVDVRNALIVTEDGSRGNLVLSVVNQSRTQQQLSVQYESSAAPGGRRTVTLPVAARSVETIGAEGSQQLVLEGIDTTPGALFPVFFSSGNAEGAQVKVPVLDPTLAEYQGLLPSPSPTPTPVITPTPIATPTPVPGGNSGTPAPGNSVSSGG